MTAGSHKTVHPHLPKTGDRCVRLILDFSNMQELIGFARRTRGLYGHHAMDLFKVTASQYHSVPVGNHYIIASGGHDDLKLTPDRIATIIPEECGDPHWMDTPPNEREAQAEYENYNDHRDKDTL